MSSIFYALTFSAIGLFVWLMSVIHVVSNFRVM